MSEALLSDNQMDIIRNAIAKDKKEQLARTKESYRKLKRDRVKDILNNPSGINDEKVKQNRKEAVKHIINQNFEDSIVTASYDQKIIGLCEKQMKEKSIEVRLTLNMLYRDDEIEEKLNDQERIRSEHKSRQVAESRKSLFEGMQESRKEEMLISPSPLLVKEEKEEIVQNNAVSYPQSSAQVREISHSNQEERPSQSKEKQSFSLGRDSVSIEQNEPTSQQDASFNSSIINSPAFLTYDHSQHPQENESKQEKLLTYPQMSPPPIDSLQQNLSLQEAKIYLPEPKIEDIFENLQLKTEVVPPSHLSEPIVEQFQQQDRVASSPAAICETEKAKQAGEVEQQIAEQSPKDLPVQSSAPKPQNSKQSQPQSSIADPSPASPPKVEAIRVQAKQILLLGEHFIENISINEFPDQTIRFIYKIIPSSAQDESAYAQITGIQGKEEKEVGLDENKIIQ